MNLPFKHVNTDWQFFLKLEVVFTINIYYLFNGMDRSARECKTEKSIEWVNISNRLAVYKSNSKNCMEQFHNSGLGKLQNFY